MRRACSRSRAASSSPWSPGRAATSALSESASARHAGSADIVIRVIIPLCSAIIARRCSGDIRFIESMWARIRSGDMRIIESM